MDKIFKTKASPSLGTDTMSEHILIELFTLRNLVGQTHLGKAFIYRVTKEKSMMKKSLKGDIPIIKGLIF